MNINIFFFSIKNYNFENNINYIEIFCINNIRRMSNLKGIDKYKDELIKNARYIVQKGKGILAADESTGTIGKRFAGVNVENTEKNRRAYRELLFTAPGLEQYISGTILYDETVYQKLKKEKDL